MHSGVASDFGIPTKSDRGWFALSQISHPPLHGLVKYPQTMPHNSLLNLSSSQGDWIKFLLVSFLNSLVFMFSMQMRNSGRCALRQLYETPEWPASNVLNVTWEQMAFQCTNACLGFPRSIQEASFKRHLCRLTICRLDEFVTSDDETSSLVYLLAQR